MNIENAKFAVSQTFLEISYDDLTEKVMDMGVTGTKIIILDSWPDEDTGKIMVKASVLIQIN